MLDRSIDRWREQYSLDSNSLGFYRVVFCLWFIVFAQPSYAWIADVPKAFFFPPILSLATLFETFPEHLFFTFLDMLVVVSTALVAIGFLTRVSTTVLLLSLVVGNSFTYSFGKIDHRILIECVLLVMLLVNWGHSLSVDQVVFHKRRTNTQSLWLLAVFVTFGFFSAAFGKALAWIDFDFSESGFLSWLYMGYYSHGRQEYLAPLAIKLRPLWIWEFADISAVIFELGFVVALLRRRWFTAWLTVACFFHLTTCLVLNISFYPYAICYLAFVSWSKLFPKVATLDRISRWAFFCLIVAITLLTIGSKLNWFRFLQHISWEMEVGNIMWSAAIIIIFLDLAQPPKRITTARQQIGSEG